MAENLASKYGRALEDLPQADLQAMQDVGQKQMTEQPYLASPATPGVPGKSLVADYYAREAPPEAANDPAEKYGRPREAEKEQEVERTRQKEPGD